MRYGAPTNRDVEGKRIKHDKNNLNGLIRNFDTQYYKGIPLKQIDRGYGGRKARRFNINGTSQNCWIPLKHLEEDGTIKDEQDLDYVIINAKRQFALAGISIKFEVGNPNLSLKREGK